LNNIYTKYILFYNRQNYAVIFGFSSKPSFLAGGDTIFCKKFDTNLQVKNATTPNSTAWTPATTNLDPFFGILNKTPGDRTKKRIAQ